MTKQPEAHTALYDACQEILRLEQVNAELLEALKHAENALADYVPTIEKTGAALNYGHHVIKMAKTAIAKAEVTA